MVNPNYREINVAAQEQDKNSLLSFYKQMIALRKNQDYKETLVYGDVICPASVKKVLLNNYPSLSQKGDTIDLLSYQAVVLELA